MLQSGGYPPASAWVIMARTARRKSPRLLIAHSASNQTASCAASIIASDGTASGFNAARARRRYRDGSAVMGWPSALAMASAMRSIIVVGVTAVCCGTTEPSEHWAWRGFWALVGPPESPADGISFARHSWLKLWVSSGVDIRLWGGLEALTPALSQR